MTTSYHKSKESDSSAMASFNVTKVLTPSIHLHTFKKEEKIALFHTLSLQKVFGTNELLQLVKEFEGKKNTTTVLKNYPVALKPELLTIVQRLYELNILVDSNRDESIMLQNLQNSSVIPNSLKLLVTHRCNFNCAYCQIEKNMRPDFRKLSMTPNIVDKALELFGLLNSSSTAKTVIITGGEPMLNLDTVRYSIENTPQKIQNTRIVLFTNGSLATKEWAEFLARHDVLVLVSIDSPATSMAARSSHGKEKAHTIAMQGYNLYKEAGCQVGISAVVTPENIEMLESEGINFFLDLAPRSLGLNFPHYLVNTPNPEMIDMEHYVQKLIAAYKIARKQNLFIEQMSRKIIPFANNKPRLRECSASGLGITIDSRGYVGACKVPMVNIGQGQPIDKAIDQVIETGDNMAIAIDGWTGRSSFNLPQCQGCFAISVCGGGCAYDSWCLYRDTTKIDPRTCTLTKRVLEFLIWDLYEHLQSDIFSTSPIPYLNPSTKQQKEQYPEYFRMGKTLSESAGHSNRNE